jgi:hypothetical protein
VARHIPILIPFVCSIFIAHVALPLAGINEWGPFFTWSLFAESPVHQIVFDLEIDGPNGIEMYSSSNLKETQSWVLLQRFAQHLTNGNNQATKDLLLQQLNGKNLRPLKLYKIKETFPRYILLTPQEKFEHVEPIFQF